MSDLYDEFLNDDELRNIERLAKQRARETRDPSILDLINDVERKHEKTLKEIIKGEGDLGDLIVKAIVSSPRTGEPIEGEISRQEILSYLLPMAKEINKINAKIKKYVEEEAKKPKRRSPFSSNHRRR